MDYSTEELLAMAFTMLTVAKEEQEKLKDPKRRWLLKNSTMNAIEDRVVEIKAKKREQNR